MRQVLRLSLLIVVLSLVSPISQRAAGQPGRAYETVEALNRYRAALGLPALQIAPSLMAAAQGHAEWMARTYIYSHTGEGGTGPWDRAAAAGFPGGQVYENVAGGTSLTPEEAIGWWDRDWVHQNTMRLPGHTHVGVGYAENDQQQLYVLLVGKIGTPAAPPATAAPRTTPLAPTRPTATRGPVAVRVMRSAPREDGSVWHLVQTGQTAWDIAVVYGVSLDDLLALNGLTRGTPVHPGDELLVRLGEGQVPPPTPTPQLMHVIKPGETLWTVAALHGLTLDDLLALNGLARGHMVHPGDELLIRAPDSTATPTPSPLPSTATPSLLPSPSPAATALHTPTLSAPTPSLTAHVMALATATRTPSATITLLPSEPAGATPPPAQASTPQEGDQGPSAVEVAALVIALGLIVGTILALMMAALWFRQREG